MPQKPLQIGVMLEAVQFVDVAAVDIFSSISTKLIEGSIPLGIPPSLVEKSHPITFHFISSTLEPSSVTAGLRFLPTTTYATCPRDLDILIIGGPFPDHRPADADVFMREASEKAGTVMTICTGSWWLADSGVLKGKRATVNRSCLPAVREKNPDVDWVEDRWVVDGKFWTAGAAGCGIDMCVEYIKQKFDKEVVDVALEGLHFGSGIGQKYIN